LTGKPPLAARVCVSQKNLDGATSYCYLSSRFKFRVKRNVGIGFIGRTRQHVISSLEWSQCIKQINGMLPVTNINLIYPESSPAKLWVDINRPLSLALQAELIHRGYELRQVDAGLQALCSEKSNIPTFNELLTQLLDDEVIRRKIPLNTLVRLDMFMEASE
jgi:hypothetical protein